MYAPVLQNGNIFKTKSNFTVFIIEYFFPVSIW